MKTENMVMRSSGEGSEREGRDVMGRKGREERELMGKGGREKGKI